MGNFLSELKKEMGEPSRYPRYARPKSPLRQYIEDNYDDIIEAKKAGYSGDQLRIFINRKLKSQHSKTRIANTIYHVTRERKPAKPEIDPSQGFYFDYSVDGSEKQGWVPGGQDAIDRFLENLKKMKPGASLTLLSARPMSESDWERVKPV